MKTIRLILLGLILNPFSLFSQSDPTELSVDLNSYITGLSNTVDIQFKDTIMYIVDQDGKISMADGNTLLTNDFLNITSIVQFSGERGLLGLAFDPDFEDNNTFYVNYVNNSGNTVIAAYLAYEDSLAADASSASILLTIDQPYSNHNGGQIQFGNDGYLYIGMGDGGSGGDPEDRSQDSTEYLGKMLRIDVSYDSYSIPADNPFVDDPIILDEIWAFGVRNPWRFSFDMLTNDLWIADVGQYDYEEVNVQSASSTGGENYGWRCREGFHVFNNLNCGPASDYDEPIFEYNHNSGSCSITGGYVYRGTDSELLNGVYLGIDYCSGYLFGLSYYNSDDLISYDFDDQGFGFTTFGQNDAGEMYVAKSSTIYEIVDPCHSQVPLLSFDNTTLSVEEGVNYYWFKNGIEIVSAANQNTYIPIDNGTYYCVVENDFDCNIKSNEIVITTLSIDELNLAAIKVFPNPFEDHFRIDGEFKSYNEIVLYSIFGKEVWKGKSNDLKEFYPPKSLDSGSYILQLTDTDGMKSSTLIVKY
jgi:hypothetical protein